MYKLKRSINHKNYNFREKKNSRVMWQRENLQLKKTDKVCINFGVCTLFLWWLKLRLWLVDLNYNFECDWFVELSDNNLASELVGNRSFFKPITIEEIVIFMVKWKTQVKKMMLKEESNNVPRRFIWVGSKGKKREQVLKKEVARKNNAKNGR